MATALTPQRKHFIQTVVDRVNRSYRRTRYFIKATPLMFPRVVQCNVCGWQGRHFRSDRWHRHSACPMCRTGVRHRVLLAAMTHLDSISFERIVRGKRVLHFAPERIIQKQFRKIAASYLSADYLNPRRDLVLDISTMRTIGDGDFDLLLACDVLEHVQKDQWAISEIFRVLSPGGYAILTVPQKDNLATTFEDPEIVNPADRERSYGQWDHLRIYGDDFPDLLTSSGFEVIAVSESDFSEEVVQRHVLIPPERSKNPLATNFRKVFFARKPESR